MTGAAPAGAADFPAVTRSVFVEARETSVMWRHLLIVIISTFIMIIIITIFLRVKRFSSEQCGRVTRSGTKFIHKGRKERVVGDAPEGEIQAAHPGGAPRASKKSDVAFGSVTGALSLLRPPSSAIQSQKRQYLASIAYSAVARPRGFEPLTFAFGGKISAIR
jgi:hypothetical protein